jgi:WD40 repeat protein
LFTADNRRVITASPTNLVTVWDAATATEIERIPALGTNNLSTTLSPDQRLLAVGGLDGTVKIWDTEVRCLVKEWRPYDNRVFMLRFLDRGTQIAALAIAPGFRTEFKRWEVGSWQEAPLDPVNVAGCISMTPSPDQRQFAIIGAKPLQVLDCATGSLEVTLGEEGGFAPVFSHDGRFLAAAMRRRARVWEVGSWRQVAVLEQTAGATYSVGLSPDGGRLAVGSWVADDSQPALRIWDHAVERELLRLYNHGPFASWIEFSPDGDALLAVSWSGRGLGTAKLWRAPSWAEIEAAEKRALAP